LIGRKVKSVMKSGAEALPAKETINSLATSSRKTATWVSVMRLLMAVTRVELKGGEGHWPPLKVKVARLATANLV
jgi:hypothetical protein